jgi:hypothetical protein
LSPVSAWAVSKRAYRFVAWAEPKRWPRNPCEHAAAFVSRCVSLTLRAHLSGIFFLPKPAKDFLSLYHPIESAAIIFPFLV